MCKINILDTTLRDGAQSEGISFSIEDKVSIAKKLDEIAIPFIEAGNPFSNPKEKQFFDMLKTVSFKHSKIVSFGSTRHKNNSADNDPNLCSLLQTETKYVSVFGKTWDLHINNILESSLVENISMIEESCSFLTKNSRTVFFDAEHFFDGYKANKDFSMECLKAAIRGGASTLVLCDTNGGTLPFEILKISKEVMTCFKDIQIGIHLHNDSDAAVASSVMLAQSGIKHIQGTMLGVGERCGNASLASVIGNLQLKLGFDCIPAENMPKITEICRQISEIANISIPRNTPYIGTSAFSHKAGMHADAVFKLSSSFEHIPPDVVGNSRHILLSEISGKSTLVNKIKKFIPDINKQSPEIDKILKEIKALEKQGYQFEGAEASFELLIKRHFNKSKNFFRLMYYKAFADSSERDNIMSAIVKIQVGDKEKITAAEGNGPVNALDTALKEALSEFFPCLLSIHLIDYKVRVIDTHSGTASHVRVIISTSDTESVWNTVGASSNVIDASLIALIDSINYKLIKDGKCKNV